MNLRSGRARTEEASSTADGVAAGLRRALIAARNSDAGWGYASGKASRVEPTCWAILALLGDEAEFPAGWTLGDSVRLALSWQRADGLLGSTPSEPANLAFNGLAALALERARTAGAATRPPAGTDGQLERLVAGVAAVKANRLSLPTRIAFWLAPSWVASRQDYNLRGWPWITGTYSWVEPTVWCLLALKKARRLIPRDLLDARVSEAERLLADRCCQVGGWNAGQSNALGRQLVPHVPTTALGLLALQDRRDLPAVDRSLRWLLANRLNERSSMALALVSLCLHVYGSVRPDVDVALVDQVERGACAGNQCTMAMALVALELTRKGAHAFVVS